MTPDTNQLANAEIQDGENYLREVLKRLLKLNASAESLQYVTEAIATLSHATRPRLIGGLGMGAAAGAALGRVRGLQPLCESLATTDET